MKYENWQTDTDYSLIISQVEIKEKGYKTRYIFKSLDNTIFSVEVNNDEAIFATKNYFYDLLEELSINSSSKSLQTVIVDNVDLRNRHEVSSAITGAERNFIIIANNYVLIVHTQNEPTLLKV